MVTDPPVVALTTPSLPDQGLLDDITPRMLRHDISDQRDAADKTLPRLAKEPIEATENVDPMHPIEAKDPTEPMDRVEPVEPIESSESREAIEKREFDMCPSSPVNQSS